MDVPIGALGDGFEDRLVLESRGELSIWVGFLGNLVAVPGSLLWAFCMAWGLLHYVIGVCPGGVSLGIFSTLFVGLAARCLYREYRARDFQEVRLRGRCLEVSCGDASAPWAVVKLVDAKAWPAALQLAGADGERFQIYGNSAEKRLKVVERVQELQADEQAELLRSGQEIVLAPTWGALWEPATRAASFALFVCGIGRAAHSPWAFALGLLTLVLILWPALRGFLGGGMILSSTGLRKLGQPRQQEAPWSEVQSCSAEAYFQDTLVVQTRRGEFRLLREFNPVVWALVIRELKG